MYKNIKVYSLLTLMFLMMLSCNGSAQINKKSDEITLISYRRTVGRGGSETLVATKDSLIATAVGRLAETTPAVSKKMVAADWKKLVSTINVEVLETTTSGEVRGHYDGPDVFYEIKTADKTYSLVNVQDSVKGKQLDQVRDLLKKLTVAK